MSYASVVFRDLSDNKLHEIEDGAFDGAEKLTDLYVYTDLESLVIYVTCMYVQTPSSPHENHVHTNGQFICIYLYFLRINTMRRKRFARVPQTTLLTNTCRLASSSYKCKSP